MVGLGKVSEFRLVRSGISVILYYLKEKRVEPIHGSAVKRYYITRDKMVVFFTVISMVH